MGRGLTRAYCDPYDPLTQCQDIGLINVHYVIHTEQ